MGPRPRVVRAAVAAEPRPVSKLDWAFLRVPLKGIEKRYYKGSFKGLYKGLGFPKNWGVPYFGVLRTRILLFRVLY